LESDYTFIDIENWAGPNWQAAGWLAIPIKKARLGRSVVQLSFDSVSPYGRGDGPNFLLRVRLDGQFAFLTNSARVVANKPGTILMEKKGRVFEGVLPRGGVLTEAAVDYGKETVHYAEGDLNAGNNNNPRFTSLRFIPATGEHRAGEQSGNGVAWEAISFDVPEYYAGPNWSVASWSDAKGKRFGAGAIVRLGYDLNSIYRAQGKATPKQNFLCRLVFKSGSTLFLTNNAEVARRKGGVVIMEQKDDCFETHVSGQGELKEVAVDFGESSLAYGRGTWSLNAKNQADVRFNSLKILPVAETSSAQAAAPKPAPEAAPQEQQLKTKIECPIPAYYGGPNWVVAVFTEAAGLKLKKGTALRLHFDHASCFNKDEKVNFLLRVVFENGKTIYASNSRKIADAASGEGTAHLVLNKANRCFEGTLAGLDEGSPVKEIAVDFGSATSHLAEPLNTDNNGNPRFSKLTVLERN
jgi:hypothetical protein